MDREGNGAETNFQNRRDLEAAARRRLQRLVQQGRRGSSSLLPLELQ